MSRLQIDYITCKYNGATASTKEPRNKIDSCNRTLPSYRLFSRSMSPPVNDSSQNLQWKWIWYKHFTVYLHALYWSEWSWTNNIYVLIVTFELTSMCSGRALNVLRRYALQIYILLTYLQLLTLMW